MMEFNFKEKLDKLEEPLAVQGAKAKRLKRGFYITGFIFIFLVVFCSTVLISGESSDSWLGRIPFIGRLISLTTSGSQVKGEADGRINILLLGMGGEGHDGAYLADTIILASLDPKNKKVALLSIPRDLSIPVSEGYWQKINSINAYAVQKGEDGSQATADVISREFGVPIHYYLRADFDGFLGVIDELGGIDVEVENTLDDYAYPIRGQEDNPNYDARYEHLHIEAGLQHMDGELALKYARSRHALGKEGSDFARGRRQQKIISAVKDKLLKKENLLRPGMMARIAGQLSDHISTDIKSWEGVNLWSLFKNVGSTDMSNYVLDDGPNNFLVQSKGVDGAFILIPKTGNFQAIKTFVQNIFGTTQINQPTVSNSLGSSSLSLTPAESASVEIKNGTNVAGLASQSSGSLKSANFTITRVSNASRRDFEKSVVYDLTYGEKKRALEILVSRTGANIASEIPDWLAQEISQDAIDNPNISKPDFILVLGSTKK